MASSHQTRMELTSGHAKEINAALSEQNFGVSPLDQFALPASAKRRSFITVPGIPRTIFNQLVEATILEYAMHGEYLNFSYQTARSYLPSIPKETYSKVITSPEYHNVLVLRGVRSDQTDGLSGDQMRALSVLSDVSSHKPLQRKLKDAGIEWYQWQTWLHSPLFKAHHDRIADKVFNAAQSSIDLQVAAGALDGKLDFIKYYNELTGRHSPDRKAHADVQMIINEVINIIQRNVQDSDTLQRMASELALVVSKLG